MSLGQISIPNPKRRNGKPDNDSSLFPFYAGYSQKFAKSILSQLCLSEDAVVMDPWNGSGTTTLTAAELGLAGKGFDLNPVMKIVACARLATQMKTGKKNFSQDWRSLIARHISRDFSSSDLLRQWFDERTSRRLRALVMGVSSCKLAANAMAGDSNNKCGLEASRALLYVALFRTVRALARDFLTSNPTWIRHRVKEEEKVTVYSGAIASVFAAQLKAILSALPSPSEQRIHSAKRITLGTASSTALPCADKTIECVLTSPPYCTRIDYAVATLPELAVLGVTEEALTSLRGQLMGSVLSGDSSEDPPSAWGSTCCGTLDNVRSHPSKASATYYYRGLCKYFRDLYRSFSEIARSLKDSGYCVMVLQDSYYKDINIDLAKIAVEMGEQHRLRCELSNEFESHSLSEIHPHSKKYRTSFHAKESVVILRKSNAN